MIIVGYTGRPDSAHALTYAARLAAARGTGLRIIHAFDMPAMDIHLGPSLAPPSRAEAQEWCTDVVAEAEQYAREAGASEVVTGVELGSPAAVLVESASADDLVVVGCHARNEVTSALLGSVSRQVSAHAPCPVLVVCGAADTDRPGPVLVGVDGSETSHRAAGFAADWAAGTGVELIVVSAWQPQTMVGMTGGWALPVMQDAGDRVEQATHEMVEALRAELSASYPGLEVTTRVESGDPARVLADAADGASLLAVGSRGHGGFSGLLLGSVSHRLLHEAPAPIAVVK